MTRAIKVSPKSHFEYRRRRRLRPQRRRRFLSNDCCLLSTATKTTDDVLFLASLLRCHNRIPLSFEQLEHDYLGGTKRNFTSKTRTTHLWHLFCAYMTFELQFRWWIDDILYFGHFFRFPPNFTWWKSNRLSSQLFFERRIFLLFLYVIRFEALFNTYVNLFK